MRRAGASAGALLLTVAACTQTPRPNSTPAPSLVASSSSSPSPSPTPDEPVLVEVGGFDQPTHVASPPDDGRLFVVEKAGRVKVLSGGGPKLFLDITRDVVSQGERGMFSIAFDPNYARSGLFYVSYTDRNGDSRVVEYKVSADPDRADPASRREILFVRQPFSNHNGGLIMFDPSGMLVVGLGDGGSAGDPGNRAASAASPSSPTQNLSDLLGKLLRIDPRKPADGKPYGIPSDNPFVGRSGAAPEVLAYGLRNPWRFWFDGNGDLWLADVGQNRFEEVDFVPRAKLSGANFGWRKYEGDAVYSQQSIDESDLVKPIHVYPTGPGGTCAVTGGPVYRGEVNKLRNLYLFADVCVGALKGLRATGSGFEVVETGLQAEQIVSIDVAAGGQVYVVSLSGKVYRIAKK